MREEGGGRGEGGHGLSGGTFRRRWEIEEKETLLCSLDLTWQLFIAISYSFLKPQFTYMIFIYSQSIVAVTRGTFIVVNCPFTSGNCI